MRQSQVTRRRFLATAGAGGAVLAWTAVGGASRAAPLGPAAPAVPRQAAPPPAEWTTRPPVLGTHGMVGSGHPLASRAALRVLQEGGNAVDAALAATGVLGVLRPYSSTLGGDLFALVHD